MWLSAVGVFITFTFVLLAAPPAAPAQPPVKRIGYLAQVMREAFELGLAGGDQLAEHVVGEHRGDGHREAGGRHDQRLAHRAGDLLHRDAAGRRWELQTVGAADGGRGDGCDRTSQSACRATATGVRPSMTALTPANQLTLLRVLLIPAFVILVIYGHFGWALLTFAIAGATDAWGLASAPPRVRGGRLLGPHP